MDGFFFDLNEINYNTAIYEYICIYIKVKSSNNSKVEREEKKRKREKKEKKGGETERRTTIQ